MSNEFNIGSLVYHAYDDDGIKGIIIDMQWDNDLEEYLYIVYWFDNIILDYPDRALKAIK